MAKTDHPVPSQTSSILHPEESFQGNSSKPNTQPKAHAQSAQKRLSSKTSARGKTWPTTYPLLQAHLETVRINHHLTICSNNAKMEA